MSVTIAGGGFLGSRVAEEFVRRGHDVAIYARSYLSLPGRPDARSARITIGDLEDRGRLTSALTGTSGLLYFAGSALPQLSWEHLGDALAAEIAPLVTTLESCTDAGVPRFLFASSGGTVYGIAARTPISESDETFPISPYGLVKLTMERIVRAWAEKRKLRAHILRISNAYGEGQPTSDGHGAVSIFLQRALAGRPIVVWGDGTLTRDFIHVDDIARAVACVWDEDPPPGPINVGSGTGTSLRELLALIGRVAHVSPDVRYESERTIDVPVNVLNVERLTSLTSWRPEVTLAEGVRRTHAWLRTH